MKLRLRFPVLTLFVLILATDPGFTQLVVKEDAPILGQYNYALLGISLALCLLNLRYMARPMQWWFVAVLGVLAGLALESYAGWGSWLVYPHVFSKITVLLHLFAMYGYYSRVGQPSYKALVFLILLGLGLNLAFFNRDALSLSAFLNNERGFSVTSAYLFVPVALLSLNWFLTRGNMLHLLLFMGCLGMIVFLQHRTVWVSAAIGIALNIYLLRRVPQVRFTTSRLLMLTVFPLLMVALGGVAMVLDNPQVVKRLESSIEDIQNPSKQGTGNWRMQQFESYTSFLAERPIAGWRLEGFEVPVQFYSEETGTPIWEDFTGHHFHSFYLDRLFYFGWLGLALVLLVPIVLISRRLLQPEPLTAENAVLVACFGTFLVYGISYDWPTYQYALMGLTLAAIRVPLPLSSAAPAPFPARADSSVLLQPA